MNKKIWRKEKIYSFARQLAVEGQWLLNEVMSHSWSLEPNSTTKYLAVGGCLPGLQHKLEVADAVVRKQLVRKGDHGLVVGLGGEAGLQDNEYKIWSMCIVPDTQI